MITRISLQFNLACDSKAYLSIVKTYFSDPLLAIIAIYGFQLENGLWCVYEQNNIVNGIRADDWTTERAIIVSNVC